MFLAEVAVAAAARPQLNLAETVERFENLRTAAGSAPVKDLHLTGRHLDLVLRSGSVTPLIGGDETVGLFFAGNGNLTYISEDPMEFPVLAHYVATSTRLDVGIGDKPLRTSGPSLNGAKALTLRADFKRLIWLSSTLPVSAVREGNGPPLGADFAEPFAKLRDLLTVRHSHKFAVQRIDSPSAQMTVAFLDGGQENLAYVFDPIEDQAESLIKVVASTGTDSQWFSFPLSVQPIGHSVREPLLPRYFLTDVHLDLAAVEGSEWKTSVTETLIPQFLRQQVFRFDWPFTTYQQGEPGRVAQLRNVFDEKGQPLLFDNRNNEVIVELPQGVEPDVPVKIHFEIEGPGVFPQPALGGQHYSLRTHLRMPGEAGALAPGRTVARRREGGENVLEADLDKPVAGAMVLVLQGQYQFREDIRGERTVRVAIESSSDATAAKELADSAFGIIAYYESLFGQFPFSELNILLQPRKGDFQPLATPGIVVLYKDVSGASQTYVPKGSRAQHMRATIDVVGLARAIAHQYWGQAVKSQEDWMTEGFSEYSAALFVRQFQGQAAYDDLHAGWKRTWESSRFCPIALASRVEKYKGQLTRDKGAYLLAALHKELGDQLLLTFLKSYQKSFRWKFGSTKALINMLNLLTKKDYRPFFEANYWGVGMPTN